MQVQDAHALEAGKSLELWVLPAPGVNDGKPVSLGLLPTHGEQHRVLSAAQRSALAGAKQSRRQPGAGRRLADRAADQVPVLHVAPDRRSDSATAKRL